MIKNRQFRHYVLLLCLIFSAIFTLQAQYQMENLDRGVVAISRGNNNLISWRMFGTESMSVSYNVYRDGSKINANPISNSTNYVDNGGNVNSLYSVSAVVNGNEGQRSKEVNTWGDQFLTIPLNRPNGGTNESGSYEYMPYDASVGDLDGDGQYEIIFKWDPTNAKDNSQSGHTGDVYLEAVKLNGTSLWRINLGQNIRAGAHYTQFMVYDFDGNGKAELICKTAPGTRDGTGAFLSNGPAANDNDNADYATTGGWDGFITDGPEYLTVFNGETGKEINTVTYVPDRYPNTGWGKSSDNTNRVDRFLAGVAYLDGQHPSAVMCRGYYGRTVLAAWDFDGSKLIQRWVFDTNNGMSQYGGKGNHQLSIADVDNDGKQEIVYGAIVIDDNGTLQHSQTWWHGDALHVGDFDLDNPGLEIFEPTETALADPSRGQPAVVMRDANSGNVLWATYRDGDIGRGICANIDSRYPGAECWGSSGQGLFDSKGNNIGSIPSGVNFAIWWDGDLERELLDAEKLDDYNNGNQSRQYTIYNDGADAINGTKANPNLQADILGDWREELIYRHNDNTKLLVFTTNYETNYRIPTLMHDPQYRTAVAWQNVAYNQPPHPSFYLGSDRTPENLLPAIVVNGGSPNEPDCNGDVGGEAYLDDCERCVEGNTMLMPCATHLEEGYYQISAVHSGLCIQNNNPLTQEVCTQSEAQYWKVMRVGDQYQIQSLSTKMYMAGGNNVQEGNTSMSEAPVNLRLSEDGNGNYYISPLEEETLYFDVFSVSNTAGERLILWENTGVGNQQFEFNSVTIPVDCNGDAYGDAYEDECGRCVGGNTILNACSPLLELETSCIIEGVQESINGGFMGTGYANATNEVGAGVEFKLFASEAKNYPLLIRYANGSNTNRSIKVFVNGIERIASVDFVPTSSWTTWSSEAVNLTLESGENNIRFEALTDGGAPNLDNISGLEIGVNGMDCNGVITSLEAAKNNQTTIFPNPTENILHIKPATEWVLLDAVGHQVSSGKTSEIDMSSYLEGVYFLKTEKGIFKILKK